LLTTVLSDPEDIDVDDATVLPTIVAEGRPSTNCTGPANGEIEVTNTAALTTAAPGGAVEYRWYTGASVGAVGTEINTANNPLVTGRQGTPTAMFTVQVEFSNTGCTADFSVPVTDDSEVPTLGPLTMDPNTQCVNPRNGQAHLGTVDYRGSSITFPDANFTINWSTGATTEDITGLAAATYTVTVTHNTHGCESAPEPIDVEDDLYTPLVELDNLVDQNSCSGTPNGVLAVTIDDTAVGGGSGSTGGYTFVWHNGIGTGGSVVATTTATPGEIIQLAGNVNYTVFVTRTATGCTNTETYLLPETIVTPIVTTLSFADNTSCALPNGQVAANVGGAEAGYTFFWYDGNDAIDGDFVIANVDFTGANDGDYAGLKRGFYTVVARDNTTLCQSDPKVQQLNDNIDAIVINGPNIITTPTACADASGSMDATVDIASVPTTAGFTFQWFTGGPNNTVTPIDFYNPPTFDGLQGPILAPTSNGNILGVLPANGVRDGVYTVVVTHIASGCKKHATRFLPFVDAHTIATAVTPSEICPYTVGDGEVALTDIGHPATAPGGTDDTDYIINFYEGGTVLGTNLEINHVPGAANGTIQTAAMTSLKPGTYFLTVQETYTGNSCIVGEAITIDANAKTPVVNLVSSLANTNCLPSPGDGAITISVARDPLDVVAVVPTYTVDMNPDPNTVFPTAAGQAAGNFTATALRPNFYTFTVTASTQCVTTKIFEVIDNPTPLEIVNAAPTPAEYCDVLLEASALIHVGSVEADGANDNLNDYQFNWFDDIALAVGDNVYSATGDNTAANGGEHFENGVNGVGPGTVFAGSYWVQVTKTGNAGATGGLGCKSAPVKVDILDESIKPVVALTPFSNTSCAPGLPEGEIEVDVTDASTVPPAPTFVYRYTWTGPTAIAQANFNGTSNLFPNLLHGAYQLTTRNNATGCETVANTVINQNTTPIFVATVNSTAQLLCSPDGSLTVTQIDYKDRTGATVPVAGAGLGDFTYQWFRNGSAPGNAIPAVTTNVLNSTNFGGIGFDDDYYVIATRTIGTPGRDCKSAPFQVAIDDQRKFPVVTLTPFNNTSCSPGLPEGEIEVDVTDASIMPPVPGPAFDYSYTWTTAPTPIATATFDGTDNLFTGLLHGSYQVTVTNTTTSCPKVANITVLQNLTPIFVAQVNTLPQQLCSPDGSLTVAQITFNDRNGAPQNVNGAGLGQFSFQWFRDGNAPGNAVGTGGTVLNNVSYPTIGFDDDYYVVATRTAGAPGRDCASAPFRVSIADQRKFPVVSLTPFNNTSCSPGQPEGEIEVDVTDASVVAPIPGPAFDYSYAWTTAPTPIATATFDGTDNLFTGLLHGSYQVTVTNTTTSCPKVANITVLQNLTPIFVAQVNTLPQLLCSPDGSLTVAQISFNDRNGAPQNVSGAGLGQFSFQWFRDGSAPGNAVGAGGTTLNNVSYPTIGFDDDYYVVATRTAGAPGRDCASAPFRVSIADQRVFPVASLTPFSNTSCAPGLPEGEIEVDVTDASVVPPVPGPAFQYSYAWTGTGTPIATANFNGTNNLFSTLLHGNYQLTVTNTTTQCQTVENTIIQQNTTPIFVATVNALPQQLCNPDGSLTVTQINFNDRNGASQNVTGAGLGQFSYQWFRNGTNPGDVVGAAANVLNSGNYATIGFDDDYYVIATRTAGAPGRDCSSAPFRVAIDDQRVFPVVTLSPLDDTSCDNVLFEGDIEVDVTDASVVAPAPGPAFTFTYAWTALTAGRTAPATPANPYNGLNNMFNNVQDGSYQLVATNTTTGCAATEQTIVTKNTTPVFVSSVTATPQLLCAPDGSLQLTQIRFTDRNGVNQNVTGAALADFEFTWFRDGTAAGNQVGTQSTLLNNVSYPAIGADPDYFVVARRIANGPGFHCQSAPFRTEIDDLRVLPVVNLTTDPNTVCDNSFDGSMNVLVTDASTVPGPFNFNYTWTALTAGRAIPVTTNPYNGNNNAFPGMQDGVYQLVVQNNQSLCTAIAAQAEVLQILPTIEILSVTKIDQSDCAPFDGSITVDATNASHVSVTGTYAFTWTRNGAPVVTPTPSNILAQINAGNYTVTGTKSGATGSGCATSPFPVEILDLLQRPAVDLFALSNFACNTSFNGQISATITEGTTPGIIAGYSYQWFTGLNNTTPANIIAGATTNAVTSLQHGDYTVRVVDTASPGLGCETVATAPINFAETDFTATITTAPQTLCAPTQDGSVAVVTITETIEGATTSYNMAVVGDRTRFGFQWFDDASAPITAVVNGANTLTNRLAGAYFVQATNPLGCSSVLNEAIIEDETQDPVVTLDDFANPTICLLPETGGFLQVSADNSLNFSDYTFTWFDGPDDTGTQVVADNPTLSNIFHADPDVFTVRVTNKATNCFRLETYTFQTDTVTIRVTASSVPLSNCVANNGSLFAAVQQGNGNLYNYEWYRGLVIDGTPDFTTKEVLTAPLGVFTVIARHPLFAFCPSESDSTEVMDGRVFPDPLIEQLNPVTYCDPANPNGEAIATVGGTDLGYTFDWYIGAVSGSPFYSGSQVSGLSAITYSVQATDLGSGCAGTQSIEIEFDPIPVPSPSVVILSHRTNCLVPDGALTATVNGNVVDYTIQWYDGENVLATTDNDGEFYRDLDVGPYTTTATDVITKCVSAPVITEILPFMELPEFDIETTPTYCDQNVGEARYIELNDVVLSSIIWDVDGAQLEGNIISNLPKGVFTVTATSVQQCVNSKEFEILPEILVYNGISRNGDGKNDFFEISCIEDFPNNTVKIFNRAGTLVYQTKGYNNADVIFEGTSNEGLSLMGRELPDGTYFYIIDKGEGSIPKTGYLELLRQPTN
jgi:gliding motility-associated-like protein